MKYYLRIAKAVMIPVFLVIVLSGCKKDDSNKPDTFEVKYEVVPVNNYIINFIYNDASQKEVDLSDPNQFSDGIKKITVSTKPFTAKFRIVINNTSLVPIEGQLLISVNGNIKKSVPLNAMPEVTTEAEAEYTIR